MQVIFIITLFVLLSFFIAAPDVVFHASQSAVLLWANTIVPSMLPFFILNAMLNSAGGIELIGRCFRLPAEKLLKLPGEAAFVLAAGYSTGVPVSAYLVTADTAFTVLALWVDGFLIYCASSMTWNRNCSFS